MYTGIGGGLYAGIGGGLYTGPCDNPYRSNWPPRAELLAYMFSHGFTDQAEVFRQAWGM